MNAIDDGGPAYPSHGTMGEVVCHGMSLRDHFAGLAMQGLIARDVQMTINAQCVEASRYADAMLAARKVTP
jgi:hypothetical protein